MKMKHWAIPGMLMLTVVMAGCAEQAVVTYTPPAAPSMSLRQAEAIIKNVKHGLIWSPDAGPLTNGDEYESIRISDRNLEFVNGKQVVIHSFPLEKLSVSVGKWYTPVLFLNKWRISVLSMKQVADAIMVIKENAPDPAQEAAFANAAEFYRNASVKPVPGENVRRYQVMAEDAIRQKQFSVAVQDYKEGLKIAPWWPQGHFNAAMVLGELHFYDEAIAQMQKYLVLVPDAPNARAAQDQIYRWQSEAQAAPAQ